MAGEGAGIFRPTGAVLRDTITAVNADPQKIGGATRPGGALAHELAHARGDRIGVDDALDCGLAVGCVGASEGVGGPETCSRRPWPRARSRPFAVAGRGERNPQLLNRDGPDLHGGAAAPVEEFNAEAKKWLETAKDHRWKRPYTELAYQPMLEVLRYLRDNAYETYIVTGGGQDFVRVYAEKVYGIPPEQVVGTAGGTKYAYASDGKPFLTKEPKLILNDNNAGKPEGIHLMIGRRPYAAFGNSTGDRQMLEYTEAGGGARLSMLVLHDDAAREYAYGPAQGCPTVGSGPSRWRSTTRPRRPGPRREGPRPARTCRATS